MTTGAIILVDWRGKHYAPAPGRTRPAIVVVDSGFLAGLRVLTVVPLTGDVNLAPPSLSVRVNPNERNGLKKPSYAPAWNIQTVAIERTTATTAAVSSSEVEAIRSLIIEHSTSVSAAEG